VGLNPLVSTQFNFYDVGVKLDITPKVHGRDEISMHVEVELSNKSGDVDLGGLSQPIISLRRLVHDIRIKEGEVNLLGGLLNQQDTRTVNGIPGLANIPVLGRLFGPEHVEKNRGEMLIALIPHVVRAPDFTETNLRGVSAGNDQNLKLNYAPRPQPPASPTTTPGTPAPAEPAKPQEAAPAGPALSFAPEKIQVQPNSTVNVTLNASNVTDLFMAPLKVQFDPKILRLTSVRPGNLMSEGDNQKINFSENTLNDTGEATITLNRIPGSSGVSGSGPLLDLTFEAVAPGTATVSIVDAGLQNLQLQPVKVNQPVMTIVVQ
jgi:general secretion pathway protein D